MAMKLHLASDMHMEFWPDPDNYIRGHDDLATFWQDVSEPFTGGDVLILAGDIFVARELLAADNPASKLYTYGSRQLDFLKAICSRYTQVLLVLGNHEHYRGTLEKTAGLLKDFFTNHISNITVLDNEHVKIDNVVFYGGTAWTDMNRKPDLYGFLISRQMSDYKVIKSSRGGYHKLRAMDTVVDHLAFLEGLRDLQPMIQDHEQLVVISHHAPHIDSLATYYRDHGGDLNYGYYSDLTEVMLEYNPVFWFHGHVHNSSDYQAPHTQTRVIANPWGYQGHETDLQLTAQVAEYEV